MQWRREITYNLTGTLDGLTLLDQTVGTEQDNTNLASFQVHAHALDARGEPEIPLAGYLDAKGHQWQNILDQLFGLDVRHTVDTGDAITIQRTRLVHCKN